MKKRIFAGALALLMIIGLLPVSSMLKRPVEAQAAGTTKTYKANCSPGSSIASDSYIPDNQDNNFFKAEVSKINKGTVLKINDGAGISFEIKGYTATVAITWSVARSDTATYVNIIDEKGNIKYTGANEGKKNVAHDITYTITESGKYTIKNVGGSSISISALSVTVPTYTITTVDGDTSNSTVVDEGSDVNLNATGDNFLYWQNSNGRVVSRESSATIKAYYDEKYTAVYGSDVTVYYMTAYNQIYKSIASADFSSSSEPDGPIRYGYKFTGWNKSVSEIQSEMNNGTKKIFVEPNYTQDTTTKYTVTVDTTALAGASDVKEYTINEVATATTSSSDFAYWQDAETGKILSYNPTYYFFANKNMNVVAVKKSDDVKPEGVISLVFNGNNEDGDSVVIFEYTVPTGCTVNFAGVYASPDAGKLTKESADYVDGGVFNSRNTYKYTITKTKGMSTWYVKPVLEYTDSTGATVTKSLDAVTF